MQSQYDTLKNGLKIHSIVAGEQSLPPLVLIHGFPTNAYLWRNCIPHLAKHFRVYALDLPGYGQSDKPLDADYDLDFFVDFLLEYYSAMGLDSAHLAVHDVGGQLGLGFASRHPGKIKKFIVMDTLPYKEWSRSMQQFFARVRSAFWSRILLFKPVFVYILKELVYRSEVITADVAKLYHTPWIENSISRNAFSRVLCAPAEAITEPQHNLSKITAPTLILWGENDTEMGTDLAEKLTADLPNSIMETVPESGHFLQDDQPEAVTKHMLNFLLK